MAPPSPSHKRALSSAEQPSPKKLNSSKHPARLKRLGENEAASNSTTDADALWRQIPIAKPLKHSEVYCLDTDCEKHGRVTPGRVTGETKTHDTSTTESALPIHEAAASGALPAKTAKQLPRGVAKRASPKESRKVRCRGDGCGQPCCHSCWPQTAEDKA